MQRESIIWRLIYRLWFLPVWAGYWLIWLGAKLRHPDAEDVWLAGYNQAYLDFPTVKHLVSREVNDD